MQKLKILLLILLLGMTSCYSTKRLIRESEYETTEFEENKIDGIYSDQLNDSIPSVLWNTLKLSESFVADSTYNIVGNVQLNLENENLNVKLLDKSNGELIDELNLNGRIKGDYFTIDRKFFLIPLFPIFFVNKETKTILGTDKKGNLVVMSGKVNELISILWAGGQKGIYNYKFERIKN